MDENIRVGLVGCGPRSKAAENFNKRPGCRVAKVCDRIENLHLPEIPLSEKQKKLRKGSILPRYSFYAPAASFSWAFLASRSLPSEPAEE